MVMKVDDLKDHILKLENDLVKSEVRKSAQKLNDLLADDFFEFCSNGKEYRYKNGDVLQEANDEELFWQIIDFKIEQLSDDYLLALYKVIKHTETDENKKYTHRSSIWKCVDGKWKMYFHQGTYTSKFEVL
ncbi:hypothetical protein CLROS_034060 [Clostridium felsineum]|uniref:Uncharacterized protein n=2 Tax=Clostridium felsineum TaxID=36839 RepID=A0A1S8MH01_9CLOT|nr:hypothetical protein CLROS_034060 [Clostridium felsineum]URZ13071.1 hypothetical protein CROST_038210 [Clostridium felsineum]